MGTMLQKIKNKLIEWEANGIWESLKTGTLNLRTKAVVYLIERTVNKMNLQGSWQPKILGAIGLLTLVANAVKALIDGDPATNVDWTSFMAQASVAIALFRVRQDNKTSEDVGVK